MNWNTLGIGILLGALFSCGGGVKQSEEVTEKVTEMEESQPLMKFDFGGDALAADCLPVKADMQYSTERGYGLLSHEAVKEGKREGNDALHHDFLISEKPFYFVVDLPAGNYKVKIGFGNAEEATFSTVKAESRRLMIPEVATLANELVTQDIVVNVRTPQINETEKIRLKSREFPYLNWDNRLTLEFGNKKPCITSVEIMEASDVPTVFLAGNSTVVDQEYEPWAAWGQMFPSFFKEDIAIANFAESGETLKAFVGEKRLQKVLSLMREGDYLFIEFAHNDQKPGGAHVDAFSGYKEMLKLFIDSARTKGATPVLVTSMHRRKFDEEGKIVNTLEDYPEAMRQTAREENVALIDLNTMSKTLYEAMGVDESKKAFVHFPAGTFPNQDKPLADNTHFSTYGAMQIARCIVESIKKSELSLANHLKENIPPFDPSKPDKFEDFFWSESPYVEVMKPDGN
ncbi:rhamnogalacturonan acetylesterase [Flexithrix dorotheae]|uniref:rhamnogalacturonan acetylesterase n=1 Tax=Flexithrix dorotheae TaxID=70993 RepID=UPI0003799FD8|nr:rhamnogalacturonan acetylesterase [Flexithrix dorotheae]